MGEGDKNYMIISIDEEKTSDKTQHPFMIQALSKLRIKGNSLNLIRGIYEKPTVNIIQNSKTESLLPKKRNGKRMSVLTTSILHCTGGSSQSN